MKKRTAVWSLLLLLVMTLSAQMPQDHKTTADSSALVKRDVKQDASRHHRKRVWLNDTITSGDYMVSIERVNDKLNSLRDSTKISLQVLVAGRELNRISKDIAAIRERLGGRRARVNLRNLYLYQSFLEDMNEHNLELRSILNITYNRFYRAKAGLKSVMKDSVFSRLDKDTVMAKQFDQRVDRMQRKWVRTDSITRAGFNLLNDMKLKASDNAMSIANMLSMLDNRLDKADVQLFGREAPYLWEFNVPDTVGTKLYKSAASISVMEQKALAYYFDQTAHRRMGMLLIILVLFVWWIVKRRRLIEFRKQPESFAFLQLRYLNAHPLLSLFLVFCAMIPFFDAYAPTLYITAEYLVAFVIASVVFLRQWERKTWKAWILVASMFIIVSVSYVWVEPRLLSRYWWVLTQIGVILSSIWFYHCYNGQVAFRKWIRIVVFVTVMLSVLSVLSNVFGRFSLAGIIGVASALLLPQAVVLPVFVGTLLEVIVLQIYFGRLRKGLKAEFDPTLVVNKLRWPLIVIAVLLWLMMLTSNLNVYHNVAQWLNDLLTSPRSIGSISFRLSSVLLFFAIIWMAHIVQRLISFLFGETGETDEPTVSKGQHSRLLMLRLLVLCGGYLLAVAASGLPIDKITIVLGALGVGIGMGLQNVVNNFVSGIILIFDGSLQIGDVIEVSGQSGKVKEIGLRASTLNTADGAEVIIPNGTILSQNIVNWTYSNDQRRVMVEISLTGDELDANVISSLINATVEKIPNVIKKKRPVILFTSVQERNCRLTVRFWSTISNTDQVKSDALLHLKEAFLTKGIIMG